MPTNTLNVIPNDPTALWIVAAAVLLGAYLLARVLRHSFAAVKEAREGTTASVTEMLGFCREERVHRETAINKICDTHDRVGSAIVAKVDELKLEFVRHSTKTGDKLDEIHDDVKQKHPRQSTPKSGA